MSSILDALERASQERQPGKEEILPEMAPLADEKNTGLRIGLSLGVVLLSIAAALWFVSSNQAGRSEQPPRNQVQPPKVAAPKTSPVKSPDAGATTKAPDEPDAQGAIPTAERIRSSSPPNQKPLVSEAVLSEKPRQKVQVAAKPAPKTQRMPSEVPQREKIDEPPPAPSAAEPGPPATVPLARPREIATEAGSKQAVATVEPAKPAVGRATDTGQADQPVIPLIWELEQGLRSKLEQLKTTIHVYHEDPSQRFVIINMHRYGEGDILGTTGYRLREISRDGIVVDYGDGLVRLLREKY